MSSNLRLDAIDENGIATVWIDQPGSNVNVLNQQLIPEFEALPN